jgi:antitoxin component YwqK of YwqJK toxin-antitoxin module
MKSIKIITLLLISIITYSVSAQNVNQFDANGKRHGVWRKNFDKTKILRYEGEFNHGKEVGTFKFYKNLDSKAVLTATRTFNSKNNIAEVKFFSSKKKLISEGKMRGKIYVGKWIYYHKKASIIMTEEYYNNKGELDGMRNTFYKTGKIAEKSFYKEGVLEGESLWYSGNGNVLRNYVYVKGTLNGPAKTYDFKGNLESEGVYQNNRRHGIWRFYKNGKFKEKKDFTRRSKNPKLKYNKQ